MFLSEREPNFKKGEAHIVPIYFRQLLAGRDFASGDPFASQMANFIYLIGDTETRKCVVVDPAWDIQGILDYVRNDDMKLIGALVTHYHPDHVGGTIFGYSIKGLTDLLASASVKCHVNEEEAEGLKIVTGLSNSDMVKHRGGDIIPVGAVSITALHTPGHTPGSQCFLVNSTLVSGDTLFIGGCGRVDLPGGDSRQMYYSLTQVLGNLPDEVALFPGHNYGSRMSSTMGDEKRENRFMRMKSLNDWLSLM
ncbi:MAG: MBL fold metallo-hydrolase [Blastocatellia bacterium AA13]|nr:MAG: MBL fold metallo-hydrolase [Blastocatellia bacterium AA13]